jgi:hypothetical protein
VDKWLAKPTGYREECTLFVLSSQYVLFGLEGTCPYLTPRVLVRISECPNSFLGEQRMSDDDDHGPPMYPRSMETLGRIILIVAGTIVGTLLLLAQIADLLPSPHH